ncbi:hypothetical protein QFZ94_008549 [Paraburkholderia sp. JPY465]|uniref:hypothetical protein n=1 Tax=Paraburkholderia sp. JPY465 TaxID=3042285 RepID=UPI003D234675
MSNGVIVRRGRYYWHLSVQALYDGKTACIDWRSLLPLNGGTTKQRQSLLASSKGLLIALVESPRDHRGERLAHSTVLNWVHDLRRLIRWMTSKDVWSFSDLRVTDIVDYMTFSTMRKDGGGEVAPHTLYMRGKLLHEMWEVRHQYPSPLLIDSTHWILKRRDDGDAVRRGGHLTSQLLFPCSVPR